VAGQAAAELGVTRLGLIKLMTGLGIGLHELQTVGDLGASTLSPSLAVSIQHTDRCRIPAAKALEYLDCATKGPPRLRLLAH